LHVKALSCKRVQNCVIIAHTCALGARLPPRVYKAVCQPARCEAHACICMHPNAAQDDSAGSFLRAIRAILEARITDKMRSSQFIFALHRLHRWSQHRPEDADAAVLRVTSAAA